MFSFVLGATTIVVGIILAFLSSSLLTLLDVAILVVSFNVALYYYFSSDK
ncbi:900_t:CDS:2 [Dentiscutata heterogama]|uniref:900_t:CDS:1 n=1 Tax=Dentiscutata heterogama TaxID=1316150 RepID=A0ACA9KZ83_9GLOM|nr:900_t:CDS:2 [Dentiscutata heterogama]